MTQNPEILHFVLTYISSTSTPFQEKLHVC